MTSCFEWQLSLDASVQPRTINELLSQWFRTLDPPLVDLFEDRYFSLAFHRSFEDLDNFLIERPTAPNCPRTEPLVKINRKAPYQKVSHARVRN
jgi:hypothetical protein